MNAEEMAFIHGAAFENARHWSAEEFEKLLENPSTVLASVAQAFVLGRLIADEAEILTVATHPDFQRQGSAFRALVAFEFEVVKKGARMIFLDVAADNESAIALYEKSGFGTIATRKAYYRLQNGAFSDALVMKKYLTM